MCGIYITNFPVKTEDVEKKLKSIQYRGPDNMGILKVEDITLGHLRLSILDLDNRSNQPMKFENLYLTFNGEIYNFIQIKNELIALGNMFYTTSDTEVILVGYKQWGAAITSKLNGMFSFCIYDKENQKIFGARDRLGVKPFYYYWKNGDFEICSQIGPLSKNKKISEEAISIYLDCSYIPSPYSIYQDVFKLSPGNFIEIDLEKKSYIITEYWNLKKVETKNINYDQAKRELHDLLTDAVKIRLHADVSVGSFLSGGIDSALVTSIASKVSDKPVNTFSIGFDDPKYDETKVAAQYAKILNTNHTETICKPEDVIRLIPKLVEVYDEPFADSSALPSLLLNSVTKRFVTVALSGDGGDESFLGYNHFDWVKKFTKIVKIPSSIRTFGSKFLIFNIIGKRTDPIKRILRTKSPADFIIGIFIGYNTLLKKRDTSWLKNYSLFKTLSDNLFQQTADLNIKLWLENDSNVKVDRASMAYSVEVRSPFLDYRVVEFARNLPVSFRYEKGRKKKILRDILKEYIPENIFDQPKKGFSVPIGAWMRTELRQEFASNLSDDFLNIIPNFNIYKFKKIFKLHLEGKHDYSSYIWRVYVLSKWYQRFGFYSNPSNN